jgi:hypothetical protein
MTASLRAGVCSYFPIREVGIYLGALPDREKAMRIMSVRLFFAAYSLDAPE